MAGIPDTDLLLWHVSAPEDRAVAQDLFVKIWKREGTIVQAHQWLARLKEVAPGYFRRHPGVVLELQVTARHSYDRFRAQMGDKLSIAQLSTLVSKIQNEEVTEEDEEAWLWILDESIPHLEVRYCPADKLPAGCTATDTVEQALAGHPLIIGR